MATPRPVRIPRRARDRLAPASSPGPALVRENVAGRQRATRWFSVFAAGLALIYVLFAALAAHASGGISADPLSIALFTLLAAGMLGGGWWITLRRAPQRVSFEMDAFVVTERRGRTQRFERGPALERTVLQRYPPGPFAPTPTELVRVGVPGGFQRLYLVEKGLFDEPAPAA